jgi:plastocyanin
VGAAVRLTLAAAIVAVPLAALPAEAARPHLRAAVTGPEAHAAAKQRAKRATHRCAKRTRCAQVRRPVTRRSQIEQLVDLSVPRAPGGEAPTDPLPVDPALPLVGAGDVRVELRNVGEDPHNLVVSPEGRHTPLASFTTLDPGLYERRTVALTPGRYQLWCSLESHEGLGMSVTLRVE